MRTFQFSLVMVALVALVGLQGCVMNFGVKPCCQSCCMSKSAEVKGCPTAAKTCPRKAKAAPADNRSIGAPTKYSPEKETEPIPTVDLGAKK